MKIEHIAMYVNDLETTKDFFIKYFDAKSNNGYHNKTTNFKSYFLTFEGGARLEIMNKPSMIDVEKDTARTGYIHIAFSLGLKEKVDTLTDRLKAEGICCWPDITNWLQYTHRHGHAISGIKMGMVLYFIYLAFTVNTVLRFWARPSSVVLSAIGRLSP